MSEELRKKIQSFCRLIRYDILTSTTTAGSGHPTSSLSAVELMATLFFGGFLKYDLKEPKNICNDRVIFSKGHASPLLYALYHAAGVLKYEDLLKLRTFDSPLEGHPTPRFPYVDVATGSLGQGLSTGVGMAMGLNLKFKVPIFAKASTGEQNSKFCNFKKNAIGGATRGDPTSAQSKVCPSTCRGCGVAESIAFSSKQNLPQLPNVYVLLGDSEMAEGQVWEAMELASYYKLNNLVGILDVNRLGQRGETMLGWDVRTYEKRIASFGWKTIVVKDGHDLEKIYHAFRDLRIKNLELRMPTMIIAKTIKGKGVSFLENKNGWHGKTVLKDKLEQALKEIGEVDLDVRGEINKPGIVSAGPASEQPRQVLEQIAGCALAMAPRSSPPAQYHGLVATREAYGDALIALGKTNPHVVVLDAEVSNSTFAEKFKECFPERFFEMFIAEQNMVSAGAGFSALGYIPFVSTFAAFLTRAFDQIRMAQYSNANIKLVGSHAGVSIGSDGASQMALEDISMIRSIRSSIVFYPSDAVSTFKITELLAHHKGISYLRTTREKTPVIYNNDEEFEIGGLKILHQSHHDKACIIAAGITVHESLKAYKILQEEKISVSVVDLYCVKPLDETSLKTIAKKTKYIIVVEDHYPEGGIGEAVKNILADEDVRIHHLAVNKTPRSGTPQELLRYEEIDAEAIVNTVKRI